MAVLATWISSLQPQTVKRTCHNSLRPVEWKQGRARPISAPFPASAAWAPGTAARSEKTAEFGDVALADEHLTIDPAKNGTPQDVKVLSYM